MVFSAFFSGMEIAFVSSNRMLAEMDKEKNGLRQHIISFFYQHPNNFVSTMLVGNNIALVFYGIVFANIFDKTLFAPLTPEWRVVADTLLSTLVILFTGEFLPKTFFKSSPNTLLSFFAPLAMICYIVLWPISRLATFLSKIMLHLGGVRITDDDTEGAFTKVDLDYLVQSSIDNAQDSKSEVNDEVKIFQNALDFPDIKVRDCMVPRTEINAVADTATRQELMQMFIDTGHSRIIVYHKDIDHVLGYVHSSDMFRDRGDDWLKHVREMPFVPESLSAQKLMQIFLQQKKSLGVVVDEFGGTSGIVSQEDIVEEIFGDIEDEHDSTNLISRKIADNEYELSARLEVDDVNEQYQLELPESDDYKTIGGLILHYYESFPKLNETVRVGRYEFKILKKTMTKIELVRLKIDDD